MSVFEESLSTARRRHRAVFVAGVTVVALLMALLGIFLVYSRGVAINVMPAEAAEQAVIRVPKGLAVSYGDSVYGFGAGVVIEVSSDGFQTASRVLTDDVLGKSLTVTLLPLPGILNARTSPESAETRWMIDGTTRSVGPHFTTDLDAGDYRVAADNPFFTVAESMVSLRRGETTDLTLTFEPFVGEMLINSLPEGAQVSINGETIGTTPLSVTRPGGIYTLSLLADGFNPKSEEVRLTNTAPRLERTYRLSALSGTLTVFPSPADGTLLIDGRKVQAETGYELSIDQSHTVQYEKPGYYSYREGIRIEPGDQNTLHIDLQPALGSVVFTTDPPAEVLIDGKMRGNSPLTLDLPAKVTSVTFQRDGYRTFRRVFKPEAGQQITINHSMLTEREARIAEAPPTYTNSIGMSFKLFGPARFTMGAPRGEPGQRANEFLRDVNLTRHFYAGLHEVTSAQFSRFRTGAAQASGPQYPAVQVNWMDAVEFSNWLSAQEGLTPFYHLSNGAYQGVNPDADGYRLLTEAEWEWLARRAGRTETVVFPWGNTTTIPKMAGNIADENAQGTVTRFVPNYNDGYPRAAPVGSFPPEPSGLFDLAGNVSEWVHDLYSLEPPIAGRVYNDPMGGTAGQIHVFKGASFLSGDRTTLRPAYREGFAGGRDDLGFRLGRYIYGVSNSVE